MNSCTFVVTTQALLNKAIDSYDPLLVDHAHYWKYSGSNSYIVHNCPREQDALAGVLLHLAAMRVSYGWLEYPTTVVPFSRWDVSESHGGDQITVLDLTDFIPPSEE
jgi:hypothetical protein